MIKRLHVIHVPGISEQRDKIVASLSEQIETCVHNDLDRNGCMWNWLTAITCAATKDVDQHWSVVLSDDALPLPDWQTAIDEALMYSPEPFLGLTYFGGFTQTAINKGVPYIIGPHTLWGGGIAYRRSVVEGLAQWARYIYDETGYQHDDRLVSAYAQKIGRYTALVTRAIFDQPVQESLLGHGGRDRRPTVTIATPGRAQMIRWASIPRSVVRKSGGAKDQRDWLTTYGTDQQSTDHSFVKHRTGFVKKVTL